MNCKSLPRAIAVLAALAGSTTALAGGPFPPLVDVSTLNGSDGFVLEGIDAEDLCRGGTVIGDVNGDGVDDIAMRAPWADPNGDKTGEVYVVFGGEGVGGAGVLSLSSLDGTNGFVLNGIGVSDGNSVVAPVGDVNGDGLDDFAIGAASADIGADENVGKTYVILGAEDIGALGFIELGKLSRERINPTLVFEILK